MKKDIVILENFYGTERIGKLLFSRYADSHPALFFIDDDNVVSEFSIDENSFYCEYPFGEYSLIVLKDKGIAEKLFESGVVNSPVFSVELSGSNFPVCEISDQVIDLLKEEGRFYA